MKFKNKPNECVKLPNGKEIWISRSVAVTCVIAASHNHMTYVAIEKRGKKLDKPGKWCIPCGYLDWNESGTKAVIREVYEEIGLNIKNIKFHYFCKSYLEQPWKVDTSPTENRQNVVLHYGIKFIPEHYDLPVLKFDHDEIVDAKWVLVEKLHKYKFAFNHNKLIIEFLRKAPI
jgi:8-oxo-dGTP pyrophosphatase MutT (NUDIX family)